MRSYREREQDETEDCTDGAEADKMASAQPTRDAPLSRAETRSEPADIYQGGPGRLGASFPLLHGTG